MNINSEKIFIVAGEASGDATASWYLEKLKEKNNNIEVEAVGGEKLKYLGAKIYYRYENLNLSGVGEILRKIFFIFNFLSKLAEYILKNNFDTVILVDFPGFNLRLAKKLRKISLNKNLKIIYLAPPQTWIWGAWRIKKLKKYTDSLIVLYPFEVDWYKKNNLKADFIGNPVADYIKKIYKTYDISNFNFLKDINKNNCITILPGSREHEIEKLFPIFAQLVIKLNKRYPDLKFILPIADSFSIEYFKNIINKFFDKSLNQNIIIISGEDNKLAALKNSAFAISKPGTVTLELGLLAAPAVVIYKTSWLTYFSAKLLVNVTQMSLPNLILNKVVYKEFIQKDCDADKIFQYVNSFYLSVLNRDKIFMDMQGDLTKIQNLF